MPDASTETPRSTAPPDLGGYRVAPVRYWHRWVVGALALAAAGALIVAFANGQIDWGVVGKYLTYGAILQGLLVTLLLTVAAMAIGIVLGVLLAVMRLSHNPVLRAISWAYIWIFRGTPVYLQLLLWFNLALVFPQLGLPGLASVRTVDLVTPVLAAILGLGLNQAAYTSEVVRAGILSVDEGQSEAATALGLNGSRTMRTIILPQAMRVIIPPIGNETINMLKTTALASAIGASELLNQGQHIYLVNNMIIELLIVAAVWYLIAVSVLSAAQYAIERRFSRGTARRRASVRRTRAVSGGTATS